MPKLKLIDSHTVWSSDKYSAFTDIAWFKNQWWIAFREASGHMSKDGVIHIIASRDGQQWRSAACIAIDHCDLRDPKFITDNSGMVSAESLLLTFAAFVQTAPAHYHQTLLSSSQDGFNWSPTQKIGHKKHWIWRLRKHANKAYGFSYSCGLKQRFINFYQMDLENLKTSKLIDRALIDEYPNEHDLCFINDTRSSGNNTALCLLRRDGRKRGKASALLGMADPPYKQWHWQDLGIRIGAPVLHSLTNGEVLAVVRVYNDELTQAWVEIMQLDYQQGQLNTLLKLPAHGDCSYAGIVERDGQLYISYYSTENDNAVIKLARVQVNHQQQN